MADYKKNNFNNMSLKSLGEELHGLRNVGVPEKLKNALFSSIPCEEPVETQELHKVRWLELCGISSFATAAVAMILTLVLMQTGNKSLTSQAAVIDPKDITLAYVLVDKNDVGSVLSPLPANQNEPGG